jgi:hypothetical protein
MIGYRIVSSIAGTGRFYTFSTRTRFETLLDVEIISRNILEKEFSYTVI